MKKVLKWVGIVVGCLLVIALIVAGVLYNKGKTRFDKSYVVNGLLTSIPNDSATLARGKHLVETHGCLDCHGSKLQGNVFLDIPPFYLVAPNLTRGKGGIGGAYTDQDWDRSIRHGVRPSGKSLLVMPYPLFHGLSDVDATALIAYVKSMPPVDSVLPLRKVRPLGYIMLANATEAEIGPELTPTIKEGPPIGSTAEYGKYLASHSCTECHGQDMKGGHPPDPNAPMAPPLIAAGYWTINEFADAVQRGKVPGGKQLSDFMPWKTVFVNLNDTEITAIHEYLKSLAPPMK